MEALTCEHVTKRFGRLTALRSVGLTVALFGLGEARAQERIARNALQAERVVAEFQGQQLADLEPERFGAVLQGF